VLVASEPHDDLPGWHDVPDGQLLTAVAGESPRTTPLDVAPFAVTPLVVHGNASE
jgi:hypothetical protein